MQIQALLFVGTRCVLICLLGTKILLRENSFQVITWYHSMLLDCWVLFCCDQVSETVSVHIGFFNENGGFRISDEDKKFMRGCQIVVSTCAFGGGNNLYQPIGMSKASTQKVCHSDSLELFLFLNTSLVFCWIVLYAAFIPIEVFIVKSGLLRCVLGWCYTRNEGSRGS